MENDTPAIDTVFLAFLTSNYTTGCCRDWIDVFLSEGVGAGNLRDAVMTRWCQSPCYKSMSNKKKFLKISI